MAELSTKAIFVQWEFSDEELPVASVFNDLQTKYLQTELAIAASEKAVLKFEPAMGVNAQFAFTLESEYLRGKIEILLYLLSKSEDNKDDLIERLKDQAETQKEG